MDSSHWFRNITTNSAPIMLMLTILFGMLLGLISGVLYVVLHLPPIITSLGVTLIYEGILFTITEGRYVMKEVQNSSMTAFTGNWLYAAIIIVAVLVIIIGLFDYTKFGMVRRLQLIPELKKFQMQLPVM